MWGYSFHSFSCSSHHLAGKPNHPASCWATILNLNLCHPVQPARSEAPDLGATGCAKAGGAPASTDAPSGGPPPERLAGSRCPTGPGAPSHPSSGRGQAPQPTSDHFTSRSSRLFRPLPFDRARHGAQVLSPRPSDAFATEPTTFHSSPHLILPDSACWNAPAPRRSIVAAPTRSGSPSAPHFPEKDHTFSGPWSGWGEASQPVLRQLAAARRG